MNALKEKILRQIARDGPITLAQYMQMALYDPEHGYYMKGDPFGAKGDFITAPEVSQIFGELIGLWFVQAWEDRGRPSPFHFVELGPGRGTLMADMLRAVRVRREFLDAAEIILVETSPALRALQQRTLKDTKIHWCENIAGVPKDKPLYLVANEFLDALPISQLVKTQAGWRERVIAADGSGLILAVGGESDINLVPRVLQGASEGSIFESSATARDLVREVAKHIAKSDGAALFIDYGHDDSALGDTFQAVKAHKFADPLAEPGEADLTAHVDFEVLSAIAREEDIYVFGPEPQGAFLEALGIRSRADRLKRSNRENAEDIVRAVERLTSPKEMGTLFKALAISDGDAAGLPGFRC